MTDLVYWGGPVMATQAKNVAWEQPTAILNYGRTGGNNFTVYQDLAAHDGFAWAEMARRAGLDPASVGSVGIGGFSAFHAFANSYLKNPEDRGRTSYVHLADACFEHEGATEPFSGYLQYAIEAAAGAGKLMTVTTNGPWDEAIHYCWDYGPPQGRVCYDLTSGAQCFRLVWDAVLAALGPDASERIVQPIVPAGIRQPDRAMQLGNLIWLHYEPVGGDPHGMHVRELATPIMQFYGAPWLARRVFPGMPPPEGGSSLVGPIVGLAVGAAGLAAAYLYLRHRRKA